MRIDNPPREDLRRWYALLDERAAQAGRAGDFKRVCYLDLGTRVVRLINYSRAFTPHIEKQLGYVLKDSAPRHDATLIVWQESRIETLAPAIEPLKTDSAEYRRLRIQALASRTQPDLDSLAVFDQAYSKWHPLIDVNSRGKTLSAHNPATNTYYYAVEDLSPEVFIKQGHIFVQTLNKILKGPDSALVHGAAIGLDDTGILFCARGQRGKSTLAVRAMLDGFDYVSDDYLVLGRAEDGLFVWPIYSIITLSSMMWGDLYGTLDAKFVSNNGRKDKYVFNIENYHPRFASCYPISCCMFPQIVADTEPGIVHCTQAGKGRAIAQLVHSTIAQMGDRHDIATIKKLTDFVQDLPCYQINLCRDIEKNLRCLREFLENGACGQQTNHAGMLHSRSIPGNLNI